MNGKLKTKNFRRLGMKLLLTTSIPSTAIFGVQNLCSLKSSGYTKINNYPSKSSDKSETDFNTKNEKNYKLFEDKIKNMSLEEVAKLLHVDLFKEKDVEILVAMTKNNAFYDLEKNTSDFFDDIYYMVKNLEKMKKDEIVRVLAKVENLPAIIRNINANFDSEEIEIIKKLFMKKKFWQIMKNIRNFKMK